MILALIEYYWKTAISLLDGVTRSHCVDRKLLLISQNKQKHQRNLFFIAFIYPAGFLIGQGCPFRVLVNTITPRRRALVCGDHISLSISIKHLPPFMYMASSAAARRKVVSCIKWSTARNVLLIIRHTSISFVQSWFSWRQKLFNFKSLCVKVYIQIQRIRLNKFPWRYNNHGIIWYVY